MRTSAGSRTVSDLSRHLPVPSSLHTLRVIAFCSVLVGLVILSGLAGAFASAAAPQEQNPRDGAATAEEKGAAVGSSSLPSAHAGGGPTDRSAHTPSAFRHTVPLSASEVPASSAKYPVPLPMAPPSTVSVGASPTPPEVAPSSSSRSQERADGVAVPTVAPSVSCSTSGSTLQVTVSSGTTSDTLLVATSGGAWAITFDGSAVCVGESYTTFPIITVSEVPTPTTPTTFQPGTTTGLTFGGAAGSSNVLDLSGESSGLTVAVNGNSATSPGTVTGTGVSDSFSGITTVDGSSAGGTTFQPGSATGVTLVGAAGSSNVLDLSGESTGLTVAVNGDSTASPGTVTGTGLSDGFSGITTVDGSSAGGTTFQPGTATGVTFVGTGGSSNVLDLSAEPSGFTVAVHGDSTPSPGSVTGTGVSDSFSGITTVDGSSAGGTTFQPGSATGLSFAGQGVGNTLDLSGESLGLTVTVNRDSSTSLGTVTGTGLSDTFSGMTTVDGSSAGGTTFRPGTATGVTFVGAAGSSNVLDLSGESAGLTVTVNGDSSTNLGMVTGTGLSDSFSGITTVDGSSAGGTTFQPGTATGVTFVGPTGSSNVLDLSNEPSGLTVTVNGDSTASPGTVTGTGLSDSFSGITTVAGSSVGGTTFQAGSASGILVVGQGGSSTLDLPSSASLLTVGVNGDSAASPGTLTGGGLSDSFEGITSMVGNRGSGGATFQAGGATGLTFVGAGSGPNSLSLAAETAPFTVAMNADSAATPGSAKGSGVSDTFYGMSSVTGSPGGTTFQPGTAPSVSLIGVGSATTLDLSSEPSGLTVAVSSGSGTLSGTGISDSFSGISTFVGSSAGGTRFQPGNGAGMSFAGQGVGNTLDLSSGPSGLTVAVKGDSTTSQGSVTGTGVSDSFSGISSVDGSSAGRTTFQPGTASGVTFVGQGSGNTLDLSGEPSGPTVSVSAGTVTGGGVSDSFSGITTFVGSTSGGTTFVAGTASGVTLVGQGSSNTLDLSGEPSGLTVAVIAGTVTATGVSDSFSDIATFVGSSSGSTTFVAGTASGVTLVGQGSSNTLDLSGEPAGLTVTVNGDSTANPGTVTGTGVSDSFSGITTVDGSSAGGVAFLTGNLGGLSFNGEGSSNTLDLSAAPAGATVTLSGSPTAYSGTVRGLSPGAMGSTTDSFAGIQFFVPQFSTTTVVASSADPSNFGQTVTFTATVSPTDGGGTVSFYDGATAICSGVALALSGSVYQATCSTSLLGVGTPSISATYSGDTNYAGSTSSPLSQTVDKASTGLTTTVYDATTGSPWSGTEVTGAQAFDTASVSGEQLGIAPTGNVTYWLYADATCSGTSLTSSSMRLSGGAVPRSSTSPPLGAGYLSFNASYTGDTNYTSSASPCESVRVGPSPSTIALAPSPPVIDQGEVATLKATITNQYGNSEPAPTGTVSFLANAGAGPVALGTCSLTTGSYGHCTLNTTAIPAGGYVCDDYGGDSNYQAVGYFCTSVQTVNPALAAPGVPRVSSTQLDSSQVRGLWVNGTLPSTGTPTYSWKWLISINNGAFGPSAGICTTSSGSGASAGSKVSCQFAGGYVPQQGVPYRFELNVTDSASLPESVNSAPSPLVSVAADLVPGAPTPIQPTLDAGQTVLLNAQASQGWAPYVYQWYVGPSPDCSVDTAVGGANQAALSASPSANMYYCYGVSDSANVSESGLSATDLVLVDPALGPASLSTSRSALDVGQLVLLSVSTSGGSGVYHYGWAGLPRGCATADTAQLTCYPSATGAFSVRAWTNDTNGASVSATLWLTVSADPTITTPTTPRMDLDVGQSTPLSFLATNGTGLWSILAWAGLPSGCGSVNGTTLTCAPGVAGTYSVSASVTDSNGMTASSGSVTLIVSPALVAPSIAASRTTLDVGQSVLLFATVSGGTGSYTYTWGPLPAGCTAFHAASLTCTPTSVGAGSFATTVMVTDGNGASLTSPSTTLTVSADPTISAPSSTRMSLDLGQVAVLSATATNGTGLRSSYAWAGLPTGCPSADALALTCAPAAAGTYVVTVSLQDSNGFNLSSSALTLVVAPALGVAGLTLSRTSLDVGQTVQMVAGVSGGTGSYSYAWRGLPGSCASGSAASLSCVPGSPGGYRVQVWINDTNLVGAKANGTMVVSADPTIMITGATRPTLDVGQSTDLSATATNGTGKSSTYVWSGLPLGCLGANAPALTCAPSGTGTYLVTVSIQDSNGMVVSSAPLTLIVSSGQGSLVLSSSVSALDVGQSVTLSVAVAGGAAPYTYIWNVASFPSQGCSGLGAVLTCTAALAGPATVVVTVTDSNGVNLTSSALKLTVSARLIPGSIALDPATLDLGQTTKLTASVAGGSGGLTDAWSGLPSGCSASSSVNLTCTPSVSGTSWVMVAVTDSNGATVVDGPVSLVVSPTLGTVSVSVSATTLEVGGVVSFTSSVVGGTAPFVYSWSGLPTGCTTFDTPTRTCEPTATGVYSVSVKVTDATGASVTSPAQSVTVTKAPAPAATGLSNGLDWAILALALVALVVGLMGMFLALRSKGPRTAAKDKEASREERGSDLKEGAKPTSEAPETSREGEAGAEAESRGEMSER